MPGKRIPDLPAMAGASTANDDNLVIFDTDASTTKRILRSQLAAGLVGDLPYTPSGGISATTIPTAIAELDSEAAKSATLAAAGGAALIGNTPAGTIAATTVQAALNELDTEKTTLAGVLARLDDSDGASLVGYLPAGTGAVATNVQTKLREFVSVKDFGAVGDGVADDTAAIQAAINAAAGATVIFPAGIYGVTGTITLPSNATIVGTGTSSLYPNFTTDWQVPVPSWGLRASTIQRLTGNGPLFSAGRCEVRGLVFRHPGTRNNTDTVFSNNPSHVRFISCVVQNMEGVMPSNIASAFGGWLVQGCQFTGCARFVDGVFLDNKIVENTFTSFTAQAFNISTGGGLNLFVGNRFEWAELPSIRVAGGRNNVITGNLFDAHATHAIDISNSSNTNTITSNLFWRNGRSMTNDHLDCHIFIFASTRQIINDNIFRFGGSDSGSAWVGPRSVLGLESCPNAAIRFMGNNTEEGCKTTRLFSDRFSSSTRAIFADVIDLPAGADPGGSTDDFLAAVGTIGNVLAAPARCNVYQSRLVVGFGGTNRLRFNGIGTGITFTNSSGGCILNDCSLDNITYGSLAYTHVDDKQYATTFPNTFGSNGNWKVGKIIYNSAPAAGGFIGWVKTASGSPDTWKTFGAISA